MVKIKKSLQHESKTFFISKLKKIFKKILKLPAQVDGAGMSLLFKLTRVVFPVFFVHFLLSYNDFTFEN